MARRKTNFTLEEKLEMIDNQIAEMKENLVTLEKQRKEIAAELETEQLKTLLTKIKESGLSVSEALEIIQNR